MPLASHLSNLDRAAYRHTIQDGLADVFFGTWLVAYGGLMGSGAAVFCLLGLVFLIPVLHKLQQRFTHPRIGFVEPMQARPGRAFRGIGLYFLLVLGVFMTALATVDEFSTRAIYQWTPALAGVICAGGMYYTASRSGLFRFRVYTVASIVCGVAISLADLPGKLTGTRLFLVVLGLLAALVGIGVFLKFLRCHPRRGQEECSGD